MLRRKCASSTVVGEKGTFAFTSPQRSLFTPFKMEPEVKWIVGMERRSQLLATYPAGRLDLVSD